MTHIDLLNTEDVTQLEMSANNVSTEDHLAKYYQGYIIDLQVTS
jgi:hypothetical protein